MLSSIGLGSVPLLSQLQQAVSASSSSGSPGNGNSTTVDTSGSTATSGGEATGGSSLVDEALNDVPVSPVPTADKSAQAAGSVSGTQGVAQVVGTQSAGERAYAPRSSGGFDFDRVAAEAVQRADFRSLLIDRIGQAPDTEDLTTVKPSSGGYDAPNPFASGQAQGQSAPPAAKSLDYAY
ncbi:hypothetical protein [Oceanicola sp. 22II-s10i]|uniref:hypothetical protein n=1 Tax=Oceanicola sp. 22II-s10i TaxID=1317116 RepID=UPI0011300030|nr:hypothetical protein [Oceanicola sp. 22II-s10i]